jgi:hypothetical protein
MEKKYDISIHFSLNGQTIDEIDNKFEDWINSNQYTRQFDFSERDGDVIGNVWQHTEPKSVLHHCFLPKKVVKEKGFSNEIWDFLESVSEDIICWNGVYNDGDCLYFDRLSMLENIKKLNGLSIFIGDISGGVKEEYEIAKDLGIDIILIP